MNDASKKRGTFIKFSLNFFNLFSFDESKGYKVLQAFFRSPSVCKFLGLLDTLHAKNQGAG